MASLGARVLCADRTLEGAEATAAAIRQQGGSAAVYAAQIALDQTQIDVEGRMVDLSPGMAVTVEIKTGSRRVIEYLLSPLRCLARVQTVTAAFPRPPRGEKIFVQAREKELQRLPEVVHSRNEESLLGLYRAPCLFSFAAVRNRNE